MTKEADKKLLDKAVIHSKIKDDEETHFVISKMNRDSLTNKERQFIKDYIDDDKNN